MAIVFDELSYTVATEAEFNELASGRRAGTAYPWPFHGNTPKLGSGDIGVLWRELRHASEYVRPLLLVVNESDQRRLFSRFSQLRSDLSPLSAWCHIVTPERFERIRDAVLEAELDQYDAAWAGLAVAEASILSGRPVAQLKSAACLATQSFAIGRSIALWGRTHVSEVLNRFSELQRNIRESPQTPRVRKAFEPIWAVFHAVSTGSGTLSKEEDNVAAAVVALRHARATQQSEETALQSALWQLPEANVLERLDSLTPERRLQEFDRILGLLDAAKNEPARRFQLSFLAGYLATIAAGGEASLSIAEAVADRWPEVTAFAYALGGVGENVTWAAGFDGLGRLVSRELVRSLNLLDAPLCDFSADEASILVDKQLSDPLVHLRVKQSRVATVALYPGVNLQVAFVEQPTERPRKSDRSATERPVAQDPLSSFADALMPYLLERLQDVAGRETAAAKPKWNRKTGQRKLPLND